MNQIMYVSTLDPDFLAFIASIFASLVSLVSTCVWPSALLILALIFRKHILSALPYLTRLKAGDFEFEFGRRIHELERKANDADIPIIEEAIPEPIDPEISKLYALAELNSRSAILESWLLVESAIAEAAARQGLEVPRVPSRSFYSYLKKITQEQDLSMELYSIVNELRYLRNKAVHEFDFDLSFGQLHEYIDLSIRVASVLRDQDAARRD